MPTFVRTLLPASLAPIIMLSWGFAWFAISVLIFYLGCFLPSLRTKPPPLVQKPRSPKLCRQPLPVVPEPLPEQPQDDSASSVESAPILQRAAAVAMAPPPLPSKKPKFKSISWFAPGRSTARRQSLPAPEHAPVAPPRRAVTLSEVPLSKTMKSLSATSSPKSSMSSESETTLVDHLTPAEGASSSAPAPRGVHLPSMKMFRSLSRRMSSKQKADSASRSPASSRHSLDDVSEPQVVDVQPEQATSGEVFTTKFVNPFRARPKSADRSASSSPVPSSRRTSVSRRMLASLHLSHTNDSRTSPVPDSPRSSTSSVSTAYSSFSSSSVQSAPASSSSGSSRSVPRSQPYGAPHYAPMPTSRGRAGSRRAASLTLDRPATVAEESGEEAGNVLGLEFGHGQARGRSDTVPAPQRKPFFRHRAMASESAALAR